MDNPGPTAYERRPLPESSRPEPEEVVIVVEAPNGVLRPAYPAGYPRLEDRPHFIREVDGAELCGQCATPWPCETAVPTGVA